MYEDKLRKLINCANLYNFTNFDSGVDYLSVKCINDSECLYNKCIDSHCIFNDEATSSSL